MRNRLASVGLALAAVAVAGALAYLGVVPGVRGRYLTSTPALAVAFRAKESCTCLFVHHRDEAACRAWTAASPDLASLEVDHDEQAVTSRALLFWRARARLLGGRQGCRLDP